jgi:acetyl-CoA C-acetyltransferase
MASKGIKDRVAIVGMGCTPFGEHWDKGTEDLLIDAAREAYHSAGVEPAQVDAYWLGTMGSGYSGLLLSEALKIPYKPVTRLENMCATGSEAIRNAAYAVASGAYDLVMAIGVEKLKDSGYSGLTGSSPPNDGTGSSMTAPATFALLAPAYAKKYGVDEAQLKQVLARIAWKNHRNGAKNPKAQFRKEVPIETICKSPAVAGMLGIFDCSGVSDGAAPPATTARNTTSPRSPKSSPARRTPTNKPASRIHATRSAWRRCTTALRRPSWSSWRTWAFRRAGTRGRTCSPDASTATARSRSIRTAD